MTDHFKQGGLSCPDNYNPADYVMFVAQTESIESLEEKKLFMDFDKYSIKNAQSIELVSDEDVKVKLFCNHFNSHFLIYDNNTIHTYRP